MNYRKQIEKARNDIEKLNGKIATTKITISGIIQELKDQIEHHTETLAL